MRSKFLVLFAGILLASCGPSPIYEAYVPVSKNGWFKDSLVSFDVEIDDTLAAYQIVWHLRNNDVYEYSNIYLFRSVASDRGIEFSDTAEFTLADAYGKWLGDGVGELKTNTWPFKQGYLQFNRSGNYTFTLQQAMRVDYLKGVEDIGLGVYKIENTKDGK
ncbi:gliding motility lipoprotein GldH [Owenweeksia hongkongensis]|uniref:gliding motility lipoprotein GldH n=1 Tax=Owenweeksia hongkongensis TaxID=253245 RepID=UPI003A958C45